MTEVATKNPRVLEAYEGFVKHLKNFLDEQQFNHEEYTNFVIGQIASAEVGKFHYF